MHASAHPDLVAETLLRWYRQPERYAREMLAANEATGSLETVVRLALSRPVAALSPAFRGDRIAAELKSAALHFLQRALFRADATHYQVLGLQRDASAAAIREHHRLLIQVVHPDRGALAAPWPPSIAARINRAYGVLRDARSRARYDAESRAATIRMPAAAAANPRAARVAASERTAVVSRAPPRASLATTLSRAIGDFARLHPRAAALSFAFTLAIVAVCMILWMQELSIPALLGDGAATDESVRWSMLPATPDEPAFAAGAARNAEPAPRRSPEAARKAVSAQTRIADAVAAKTRASHAPDVSATSPRVATAPSDASAEQANTAAANSTAPTQTQIDLDMQPDNAAAKLADRAARVPDVASKPVGPMPSVPDARPSLTDAQIARRDVARTAEAAPSLAASARAVSDATPVLASAAPSALALPTLVPEAPAAESVPDVEGVIAALVSGIQAGTPESLAAWLAADARVSLSDLRGDAASRAGIVQSPRWRRIDRADWRWRAHDGTTRADGDVAVRYAEVDGRESRYRLAVQMDVVRRDGRTLITRYEQRVQPDP